jgi:hypothetical protein
MEAESPRELPPEPRCLATTIGSMPHLDVARGTDLVLLSTPRIPSWVQFPNRSFEEGMMVQFTEGMPGLARRGNRMVFDTAAGAFTDELADFYARYLAATESGDRAALDSFGLSTRYAAGFAEFVKHLPQLAADAWMLKGQVTGPFTLGINLIDEEKRSAYYDDQLRDVVVKAVEMKALWQIAQLGRFDRRVIVFLDEPSLLGFGSQTYLTVSRADVIHDINEVAGVIHAQGALAGVHCEANTDWSLLMETDLDVLDFDAYDHMQAITLYPDELGSYLDRGGWLGWGLVPTLDPQAAASETLGSLSSRFDDGIRHLGRKGFEEGLLRRRALITPSCGAGVALNEPLAERVLDLLAELSSSLRARFGFTGTP